MVAFFLMVEHHICDVDLRYTSFRDHPSHGILFLDFFFNHIIFLKSEKAIKWPFSAHLIFHINYPHLNVLIVIIHAFSSKMPLNHKKRFIQSYVSLNRERQTPHIPFISESHILPPSSPSR